MVLQAPAALWLAGLFVRAGLPVHTSWVLAVTAQGLHLTVLFGRLLLWQDDRRASVWRTWLVDVPAAVWASACFVGAVPSMFSLGVLLLRGLALHPPPTVVVLSVVYLPAVFLAVWGSTVGRVHPRITVLDVPIPGLSKAFDGYRIVQLSDIHCGPYLPRWVYRSWARKALTLRPDLLAVTGDFIASGVGYVSDVTDFFAHLKAPDGIFACLGNHDRFDDGNAVAESITRGGGTVLHNQGTPLTRGNSALWIAGIDDRWSHRDDLDAALRDKPQGVPTVLLAHDPDQFPSIAARGVQLTLSGHTHGGQFAVPWLPKVNLARLRSKFTVGMYRLGESVVYVHLGNGTSGPPTRVGAPPEIAVLVLRSLGSPTEINAPRWAPRRPAGKARGGHIVVLCNRRATQPGGMHRRSDRGIYLRGTALASGDGEYPVEKGIGHGGNRRTRGVSHGESMELEVPAKLRERRTDLS